MAKLPFSSDVPWWAVAACALATACTPGAGDTAEGGAGPGSNLGKADGPIDSAGEFFHPDNFYTVSIEGWPTDRLNPDSLRDYVASRHAKLSIHRSDPRAGEQFLSRADRRDDESEEQAN